MEIVLVLPPFDNWASWKGKSRWRTKRGNITALGVGYLAAALEARGHAVVLIDAPAMSLNLEQTVAAVLAERPGVVGISCLTVRAVSAYALAAAIKAADRRLPVVMGGSHVSTYCANILDECPDIDILVPGEAETTFADLVDRLSRNGSFADLAGLMYRDDSGKIVATPPAPVVKDLDTIAPPAWHIYDKKLYRPLPNQGLLWPAATMITSRGCPWGRCAFCHQHGPHRAPYRRHSPERVVSEIRCLARDLGYREVMFWDDNFCIDERWVDTFCNLLDAEDLNMPWTAQLHVRTATRTMLERIRASGCYNIFIGIETGNQRMLDLLNKGNTLEQCREVVGWAKELGFEIRCAYIMGLPTETREMMEETFRFACELDSDYAVFSPFHAWPDTPFGEMALREGRYLGWKDSWLTPSYVPNTLSGVQELNAIITSAYRRYYLRPHSIARTLWRLRKPAHFQRTYRGILFFLGL